MEPASEASTATRTAALWIAAVFILGLALGGVAGYWYAHRATPQLSDEARRHQKTVQLTNVLALTPDQQSQIEVIFSDTQGQFQATRKNADQQIEVWRQKGRDRIRAVLTPEQLPKFEDFLRKLDEDRKNRPPPSR
jgi:Spy/CpxP family protein refolding chaperone